MIEWLQKWYSDHCDGDWEHEHPISLISLDNPRWSLSIDVKDTKLENLNIPPTMNKISEDDWVGYSLKNGVFEAGGDVFKINRLIEIFKEIVDSVPDRSA